jgi:hypothetical protein
MQWILYLLIATSVPGKADVTRKWVMPSQAVCQAAASGAKVVTLPPVITVTTNERVTSVDVQADAPATVVLVCVQEKKP